MGVVGAALRGFGKALGKKGDGKAIKSVPIAKNLTKKRKETDRAFKDNQVWKDRATIMGWSQDPFKKITAGSIRRRHATDTKYENRVAARKKENKRDMQKAGAILAGGTAASVGAHEGAKKKFPKYKKVMESDVVIKDGKLGLRPKKKK